MYVALTICASQATIKYMVKHSAGILLFRDDAVLLVHPGGPFWANKDIHSWSIPKGEFDETEQPFEAAKREFKEEMGFEAPEGAYIPLGEFRQSSGKVIHVFALKAVIDIEQFKSNMFEMEWPPKSGKKQEFPENDKAAWVPFAQAAQKLIKGQVPVIAALAEALGKHLSQSSEPPSQSLLF